MHIAFWSPAWPLEKSHNGIVTYVHWMKLALEREGHRVSVFTPECLAPESNVYPVSRRPGLTARIRRRLLPRGGSEFHVFELSANIAATVQQVARTNPIDIIEMEESFGWFADVARRTSIAMVVRLHGPAFLSLTEHELDTAFARAKIDKEGSALKDCAAITAPARHTLVQTLARYQLGARHALHIVNPLAMHADTPRWRLDACDPDLILFAGRFDLRKGADVVLQAFRAVLRRRPSAKLTFVGPDVGLPGPGGSWMHIKQYCEALFPLEVRSRIDYRGRIPNHEVAKLRARAMVTVVSSRWENAAYSLLEAMLQGCPLVCTDAGGCPESIIDGVTGRLARSADPDDFAVQVCALLEDPKQAEAMGEAARRYAMDRHSPARVAGESLDLYRRIVGACRS